MRHAVHVDTARGDVGGDEHAQRSGAEAGERSFARTLRLVAVDGRGRDAGALELIREPVGAVLRARKDERTRDALRVEHVDEARAFVGAVHEAHRLVDRLGCGRARGHRDLDRIDEHARSEVGDGGRNGCGEEERLPALGQSRDNLANVVDEAHVEHAVGLVEDEDLDAFEAHEALLHQIEQPAGRGDEKIRTARERLFLATLADAAVDEGRLDA